MNEAQLAGVQSLAVKSQQSRSGFFWYMFIDILVETACGCLSISWVANQRAANLQKMYADLVSSSSFKVTFYERSYL